MNWPPPPQEEKINHVQHKKYFEILKICLRVREIQEMYLEEFKKFNFGAKQYFVKMNNVKKFKSWIWQPCYEIILVQNNILRIFKKS